MSPTRGAAAPVAPPTPGRPDKPRGGRFGSLAGWAQRHRWAALLIWVAVLAAVTLVSGAAGSAYKNNFALPGTDSQAATDLFTKHGSAQAGDSVDIVLKDNQGLDGRKAGVEKMLTEVKGLPGVADVRSPYADASAVSRDGTIGYATVTLDGKAEAVPKEDITAIIDTAKSAESGGLQVELGGEAVRGAQEKGSPTAELAGILAAVIILGLLFGSLVAASVPLITALFAVGSALGLIVLASHVFTIADFTPPITMLVGLGVGIDYALLIFYRYRHELTDGAEPAEATRKALDAAGRTVFFAGCTVIIALLGLVALGLGSLQGVALALALTVLTTMAASLILLPALLAVFGRRIQRHVLKHAARAEANGKVEGRRWRALAAAVQRRPLPALLVATFALLALSAPALSMRLGFADAGNDPATTTSRQAYDLLAEGFGPGFNGPLIVLVQGDEAAGQGVRSELAEAEGVATASPAMPSEDGALSTVIVYPETSPQAEGTADLVHHLRDDVAPGLERDTGAEILVGGSVAASQDFADTVSQRLPLFVAVVVGMSSLLLMLVFRSVWIPVKAALLNLLSISAALGAMTLVFQYGWFGVQQGPIEAFLPVLIFAIVFGLSMDYEVFLVARMREAYVHGDSPSQAIRTGFRYSARVVVAAALIMMAVFSGFIGAGESMIKMIGFGLAIAVLFDAFVVRMALVPAVLALLGKAAWWMPRWLDRILPRVDVEGEALSHRAAIPQAPQATEDETEDTRPEFTSV
ncbi:MMPL family transporter [Streptomyces phaeochromogenes]|uniref:MMPL family transporter n=1 Tax=Streptomyces phaeochromogenes TaxID=1923 RepID=UPI00099F3945|nr:MMPL family transporter [Streptomyces phaeochromogenes]